MASSYHQLGVLAQLRSDYEEADRRYRQSLEIEEHLANQAGMAASYHQLGGFSGQVGATGEAITWHARALAIRLRLQVPQVLIDLRALARYQEELSVERFAEAFDTAAGSCQRDSGATRPGLSGGRPGSVVGVAAESDLASQ